MNLSPDIQKKAAELAAGFTKKARQPVYVAAASLPYSRVIQDELRTWHTWIPKLLRVESLSVILSGDLSRLTWCAEAPEPEMTQALRAYLVEYPIPDESFVELDLALARLKPERLGAWIAVRKDSFEPGWFLRPPGDRLDSLKTFLAPGPDLERLAGWAHAYGVERCVRFGRSMISLEQIVELSFNVEASITHPVMEIGLMLFRYLGLEFPSDPVLDALMHFDGSELRVNLLLGKGGAARVGLMLPSPSTHAVQHLVNVVGGTQVQGLELFEACLQTTHPAYLEYERLASGESLQLHYDVPPVR